MSLVRVGSTAYWRIEQRSGDLLTVKVNVLDHRTIFGREEFKVTPTGGAGETWVNETNLQGERKI